VNLNSFIIFFFYGRRHGGREYAFLHLVERITDRKLTSYNLESELRDILHERDEITHDRFDKLVHKSQVIDLEGPFQLDEFFRHLGKAFCSSMHMQCEEFTELLMKREQQSSTALTPFIAIPHIVIDGTDTVELFIVRCRKGVTFSPQKPDIKAVFILIGTLDERLFHLQALSAIAQITHNKNFEREWLQAKNTDELRDLILLGERRRLT
jgi:mannitol/fructose-specific phosphotransferase system IIA component (Ntr-type)